MARARRLVGDLVATLIALPGQLRARLSGIERQRDADGGGASAAATSATGTTTVRSETEERFDIHEAWRWFTQQVPVRNPGATTPGEYARNGIDRGFPAEAVYTLTNAFRRVTYSYESADEELSDTAEDAYRRLRERGGDE